jgi:5-methylthioribose kinase
VSYQALDENSVITYLQKTAEQVPKLAEQGTPVAAREVGDGNLNQVFIVDTIIDSDIDSDLIDAGTNTIILKQALPYLRVAGEDWQLTRERMRFETQALLRYGELTPALVPTIYHHDLDMSLVVMEYLDNFEVMRKPLTEGKRFADFASNIATFMAQSHFFTSDAFLSSAEKKAQQAAFINPELCKLQEDFVFTNPFMSSEENRWNPQLEPDIIKLRQDGKLKTIINRVKRDYMTNAQAMLHGDLHTGSLMVSGSQTGNTLKVIDPEFAFYGPVAYDVGTLFANLVLAAAAQVHHTPDEKARREYQGYLLTHIPTIWQQYATTFDQLWQDNNQGDLSPKAYWDFDGGAEAFAAFRQQYIQDILTNSALHGGCELLRRLMGIVSVYDLSSIEDESVRVIAERQALHIARKWLTTPITDASQLAELASHIIVNA